MDLITLLKQKLKTRIEELRGAIADGSFDDLIQYKSQCGRLQGLEESLFLINRILEQIHSQEDVNEQLTEMD